MIFVISALAGAKVREIMNELDRCDLLHHLEPELIFTAQPRWCAVQHADRCSVHLFSDVIITPISPPSANEYGEHKTEYRRPQHAALYGRANVVRE